MQPCLQPLLPICGPNVFYISSGGWRLSHQRMVKTQEMVAVLSEKSRGLQEAMDLRWMWQARHVLRAWLAPEWHSGLRHCISVLEASLQTPWFDSRLYHNRP
ncbi:hypothetical protein J4Q44_G00009400 [Coregonus suidteri]|uniref:Uncharacterized protein n=1 Tax=Coregonus suidteri TaxID=861788 RepID=A0AAN8MK04_9TELE